MKAISSSPNTFFNLDILSIGMFLLSLSLLSIIALDGSLTPVLLFILMVGFAYILIVLFSKDGMLDNLKLFIFFFSFYLFYIMMHDYILLTFYPARPPFDYVDEVTFYNYSNIGLPYISGEKNFLDMFSNFRLPFNDVPLHVFFTSLITYFSVLIDGGNNFMAQKLLSPFLGGMILVVLYSTLKYQFKDRVFALNATFAYGLLSAVFMYSTPLLRDTDIALAYMIVIYLFLQKNSLLNFILMLVVAFFTVYLRLESGMVLFGLTLLYSYFYVRKLQTRLIKLIFYILLMVLFSFVIFLQYNKIIRMIVSRDEVNLARSVASASTSSIGVLLNKLPFGISHATKVLFGQLQPFPFFLAIDRPPDAISGIFWPFIFIMMFYAVIKRSIRNLIDTKVKYLLMVAIAILFLMSSEPMTRRMMSVYPIMYIVSLYAFIVIPKNDIKRAILYYIFSIVSLNTFYYLIKI